MKRLFIYFSIALLAFMIGLAVQSVWSKKDYILDRCGEFILRGQD